VFAPFFANRATAMTDDGVVDAFEGKAMVETVASNMMYGEDELTREVCNAIVSDHAAWINRPGTAPGDWRTVRGGPGTRVRAGSSAPLRGP
jgi:hypothetical protein